MMAKFVPVVYEVEWEPYTPSLSARNGIRERHDNQWEVVRLECWWMDEMEVLATTSSRDAAIGFIKLLRGK